MRWQCFFVFFCSLVRSPVYCVQHLTLDISFPYTSRSGTAKPSRISFWTKRADWAAGRYLSRSVQATQLLTFWSLQDSEWFSVISPRSSRSGCPGEGKLLSFPPPPSSPPIAQCLSIPHCICLRTPSILSRTEKLMASPMYSLLSLHSGK